MNDDASRDGTPDDDAEDDEHAAIEQAMIRATLFFLARAIRSRARCWRLPTLLS